MIDLEQVPKVRKEIDLPSHGRSYPLDYGGHAADGSIASPFYRMIPDIFKMKKTAFVEDDDKVKVKQQDVNEN